jgi:hypothetical protein
VLVVGVALMVMRMGEAMRMRVGAVFGAAGICRVVHAEGRGVCMRIRQPARDSITLRLWIMINKHAWPG